MYGLESAGQSATNSTYQPPDTTTADGEREHADLAPLIEGVRGRVAAVLPPADYNTLVRLLERLVAAL